MLTAGPSVTQIQGMSRSLKGEWALISTTQVGNRKAGQKGGNTPPGGREDLPSQVEVLGPRRSPPGTTTRDASSGGPHGGAIVCPAQRK